MQIYENICKYMKMNRRIDKKIVKVCTPNKNSFQIIQSYLVEN